MSSIFSEIDFDGYPDDMKQLARRLHGSVTAVRETGDTDQNNQVVFDIQADVNSLLAFAKVRDANDLTSDIGGKTSKVIRELIELLDVPEHDDSGPHLPAKHQVWQLLSIAELDLAPPMEPDKASLEDTRTTHSMALIITTLRDEPTLILALKEAIDAYQESSTQNDAMLLVGTIGFVIKEVAEELEIKDLEYSSKSLQKKFLFFARAFITDQQFSVAIECVKALLS